MQVNLLKLIKGTYEKPIAKSILNTKSLKTLYDHEQDQDPFSLLLFTVVLEARKCNQARKETKAYKWERSIFIGK